MSVSVPDIPAPVAEYLDRQSISSARVVPLTGDASDRRYFRIIPPASDSFVVSVYGSPFEAGSLPFVNVARLFAEMPVPVPKVVGAAPDLGVLALDDLGDVTLQAHVGGAPPTARAALYRRAVEIIEIIQRRGAELESPEFISYGVAFDVDKLTWEMDFFIKHFLESYRGAALPAETRDELRAELGVIVRELALEPRVLCHRDYHSRNLMLKGGELYVIDFQDARMGPDTYDLVSLLRDSYVDLPEPAIDDLIAYYLALTRRAGDTTEFRRRFDLMALQRNLKALGTFGYQTSTRHNPVYMQYIPRTLRYARDHLRTYPRFERLQALLAAHVEELR
jgi:N-acetylmuramate 1-kinase